jgi:alpha-L-fucosidase
MTSPLPLSRRSFLTGSALTAFAGPPAFLRGYESDFAASPRAATLGWFRAARLGLFIHYGLYSLDGVHPFHQFNQRIPVREYEKLATRFTASRFDADAFARLAQDSGMKYVNLVTKHCDGFCLWDTRQTPFNSVRSPARRDLVAEMAKACDRRGLGLFLFYEHGFDWRHPHAPRRSMFTTRLTEVPYEPPEPTYAHGADYNLQRYVDFVSAQITELLTNYGPVAGIWLDGVAVPVSGPKELFRLPELYDLIHKLQPQAILSYKFGAIGTEDFLAPEEAQLARLPERPTKPIELCVPLNDGWGYVAGAPHHDVEWLLARHNRARELNANLLVNVGPLGDGSVHPDDVRTLKQFAARLKAHSNDRM